MSQTLYIGTESELSKVLTLNLHLYLNTDVIQKATAQEAVTLLGVHPNIDLIVCHLHEGDQNIEDEVNSFLRESKRKIPTLVVGNESKFFTTVAPDFDPKGLLAKASGLLGVTPKDLAEQQLPDFYPLPMHYFLGATEASTDIYVRIRRSSNEFKHIKRFCKGDALPISVLDRFTRYGAQSLYIPSSERLEVAKKITENILEKLADSNTTGEQKAMILDSAVNVVSDNIRSYGLTEESVTLSKASLKSMKEISRDFPDVGKLLKSLLANKASYLYLHCQIITYVSGHIIDNSDWGTEEHKSKLSFVSFFHDIFLTSEEMAKVRSDEQLKKANLSGKDAEAVKNHARLASEILKNYPKAPIGADTIIKQHHGCMNGIGFTKKYSNELSPLAIIFIVAEEFTDQFLAAGEQADVPTIIEELEETLTNFKYRKALKTLSSLPNT